jgi:ribosomal protein L37AE/L43A
VSGPIRERDEKVRSSASGSHSHFIICPLCEVGELRALGRESVRCESCGCFLGGTTLEVLREIVGLPDALGSHACECGHPEMHRLPDGVFHCPACGSEVLPIERMPPSESPRTAATRTVAPRPTAEEVGSFSEGKGLAPR